jgi:transcriptional regulator with XRE-family HTH domain
MSNFKFDSNGFPQAMRLIRKAKGVTQEDFGVVSSRTYVSSVERGLKNPTLAKIDELAEVLGVHPMTLLTLAYVQDHTVSGTQALLGTVKKQLHEILSEPSAPTQQP